MDNKRIATGYDVELQLMPEKVKGIIDSILDDVLPSIKKEIGFDVPINIVGGQFKSDDGHATFAYPNQQSSDVEQSPILQITFSCEEADDGSWYIKPLLMVNILGSIIDITTLSDKIKIPSLPLPFSGLTDVDIITVPASDGYTHAIVLLANIDFAKLLDIETEIARPDTKCDKSDAQSFLPKGADYVIGINKSIYGHISVAFFHIAEEAIAEEIKVNAKKIKDIEEQEKKEEDQNIIDDLEKEKEKLITYQNIIERIRIREALISTSEDTLKITVQAKYDIPKTDKLDLSFKTNISLKFSIGAGGLLQTQCDVKTDLDYNAWYNVLVVAASIVLFNPLITIVGLHTNSIIKRVTRKIRAEMSEKILRKIKSPIDYHYFSDNGVGKLRSQGLINRFNCTLRKPLAFMPRSNAYFYTTHYAAELKAASTLFDDNGASIWGIFDIEEDYPICNDVTLKKIKYYNDGRTPTLVYKDTDSHVLKELNIEEALELIKTTERADRVVVDSKNDNVLNALGKLPMSILSYPIAVQKINNELAAFKFDNGLIGKKEELIKLYQNGVILIKDVKLVGSEGNEYFISMRDKTTENNLSSLPPIEKEDMESIYIGE